MKRFLKRMKEAIQARPVYAGALVGALGFGLLQSLRNASEEREAPIALTLLGFGLICDNLLSMEKNAISPRSSHMRWTAWLLVIAAIALRWYVPNSETALSLSLLLLLSGVCVFSGGRDAGAKALLPLTLALLVLPFQEQLFLTVSYPLRLFSAIISVRFLKLLGCNIVNDLTSIELPETTIAITDACSGISQLAMLMFLGYLIVKNRHEKRIWMLLHYLLLLPIVVAANAVRLIVTIVGYFSIGDRIFEGSCHILLGYLMVLLAVTMFWAVRLIFPDVTENRECGTSSRSEAAS